LIAGGRFLTFAATLVVAGSFASPALAATTWYAAPAGSGTSCSQALPCRAEKAVELAQNGDFVVLGAGTYALAESLYVSTAIDIGGQAGAMATTIQTTGSANVVTSGVKKPNATIHDLTIAGTGGLVLNSGTAERVFVDYTGIASAACSAYVGTTLRDSVCWAHAGSGYSSALDANTLGAKGTVTLRNDTLVSTRNDGLHAEARESLGNLTVDAANVIARGTGTDVVSALGGGGLPAAIVTLADSSYATTEEEGAPLSTVTPPGTNGNQTSAPSFLDAATGNFAEAAGSPTIDAGLTDSLIGATDLLGNPRSLPACIGGTPVPDIGAYEFVPSADCPGPAPTPAPSPTPPSNAFRIGKLTRNAKKGTATLLVTVPDAGALTVSGKGVKKVTRIAKGAGKLKLAIVPVGAARRKLAATGSLELGFALRFAPTGGSAAKRTKSVKLVRTSRR
jgi:hypothetical protein